MRDAGDRRVALDPDTRRTVFGWTVIIVLAVAAGAVAGSLGVPAPWLVGPMFAAVSLALLRPEARPDVPAWVRRTAQAIVGGVLAGALQPATLSLIVDAWLPVGLAVGTTVLLSLAASAVLSRLTSLDRRTAAIGTLPGAASGMLAMSEAAGADPRLVALMQYGRVVLVVASAAVIARLGAPAEAAPQIVPEPDALIQAAWLVYGITAATVALGVWIGIRLQLPAGPLLGPLLLCAMLQGTGVLDPAWPPGVPETGFALIGVYAGLLFDRPLLRRAGRLLPALLASTLLLMAACAGLGWMLSVFTGLDYLTAYLATTPGGIDSVAVMAVGSGADASLVLAVQTTRLLAVILAGALLGRLWSPRV